MALGDFIETRKRGKNTSANDGPAIARECALLFERLADVSEITGFAIPLSSAGNAGADQEGVHTFCIMDCEGGRSNGVKHAWTVSQIVSGLHTHPPLTTRTEIGPKAHLAQKPVQHRAQPLNSFLRDLLRLVGRPSLRRRDLAGSVRVGLACRLYLLDVGFGPGADAFDEIAQGPAQVSQ